MQLGEGDGEGQVLRVAPGGSPPIISPTTDGWLNHLNRPPMKRATRMMTARGEPGRQVCQRTSELASAGHHKGARRCYANRSRSPPSAGRAAATAQRRRRSANGRGQLSGATENHAACPRGRHRLRYSQPAGTRPRARPHPRCPGKGTRRRTGEANGAEAWLCERPPRQHAAPQPGPPRARYPARSPAHRTWRAACKWSFFPVAVAASVVQVRPEPSGRAGLRDA